MYSTLLTFLPTHDERTCLKSIQGEKMTPVDIQNWNEKTHEASVLQKQRQATEKSWEQERWGRTQPLVVKRQMALKAYIQLILYRLDRLYLGINM